MNGVTDSYVEELPWPDDDDDGIYVTDDECPFCGSELEHDGRVIFCDRCEVVWHSGDELAADQAEAAALDAHMQRTP